MDPTATPPRSDSPSSDEPKTISAFFKDRNQAEAAVQALKTGGIARDEMRQDVQDDGYLVTVSNRDHMAEAAEILRQHGGSLSGAPLADPASATGEPTDPDDEIAPAEFDGETRARSAGIRRRGGVFSSGSGAGGSGSGTASGGSLFGSSR